MKKKDTMKHEETMLTTVYDPQKRIDDYSAPVPRYIDSDEMLPPGAFWPAPEEEEWTMVERSHGILRSAKDRSLFSDCIHMWRSRLEYVCCVVYLWCTVCYCLCHLWRALPL